MQASPKLTWNMRGTILASWVWCVALLAPIVLFACDATRRDWQTCYTNECGPGYVCTVDHRCLAAIDAGSPDASTTDSPQEAEDVPVAGGLDGALAADAPRVDSDAYEVAAMGALDAAVDEAIDSPAPSAFDTEIDSAVDARADSAIDTRTPDARGTCSSDDDCAGSAPFCVDGRCEACRTSGECRGGAPICSTDHTCVSCAVVDGGCPLSAPACETDSGRCVECASNDDCPLATKPICDAASNTCVACTSDTQCTGVGPSVCMFHLDGRCADDSETIYVGSIGTNPCSDLASNAGTASVPYCTAQKGVLAANSKGRALVVMRGGLAGGFTAIALTSPLTVVGKNAVITPTDLSDGIGITSGEIYLRGLTVAGSAAGATGVGINAQATVGATLAVHIDRCTISGNPGGGVLLAGAAFDIRNTVVSANGPGQTLGGAVFGGIRVDSLPIAGAARLDLVSIESNLAPGLSCSDGIVGEGVLASGNALLDIATGCGVAACGDASPTCGAQP